MQMNCHKFTVFTVHKVMPSNGHEMTSLSCIRQTLTNPKTFMCKLSCQLIPMPQISSHHNGFVFYKHIITSVPNGYSKPLNEISTGMLFLKPSSSFSVFLMPFKALEFLFTYGSIRHLVGLLGQGISPAPRPLPTQDNTTQRNRDTHPCPKQDSNPRSQCSSSRRQYLP
jgi:hypothetical protein